MKNIIKNVVISILTWEARLILQKYKPRIIAITGNVGKTSAKDAIYTAFQSSRFVRKSAKSLNTEFGVPLTIIGCESGWNNPFLWIRNMMRGVSLLLFSAHYPRLLILEVGADHPNDIQSIARWIRPDIAVVTGIPDIPVHIESFHSVEEIVAEKRALVEALKPEGTLVVNGDDERARRMEESFRGKVITYGHDSYNDFTASHEEVLYEAGVPVGIFFRINQGETTLPITLKSTLGRGHAYAALAAVAVGSAADLDLVSVGTALSDHEPPAGRMRLLPGLRDTTIIDDSYNASPAATLAALDALEKVNARGRKIVILGDMLELGRYSAEAHRKVGECVAEVADMLITIGIRSRAAAEAAMGGGVHASKVRQYDQNEAARAAEELEPELARGDVILIKGSQGMRMERAVKAIMAEPERAVDLLVRQDPAWLAKP